MKKLWFLMFYFFVLSIQAQNIVLQAYTNTEKHHILEWVVTECSYISHFELERSIDDSRFEVIYTREINSYNCNGNYLYTIKDIPKGYQYTYRIKAYLSTALPLISETFTIFYQPEHTEITNFAFENEVIRLSLISRQKNILTLSIVDILGKLHYKNTFETQAGKEDIQLSTNISTFGLYFIHLSDRENRLIYQTKYMLKNN